MLSILPEIRRATQIVIDTIVDIHKHAFAGFFLTQLGDRFLRLYYKNILNFDGGILLIAERQSSYPLGFVAGFSDASEFYQRLKRQRFAIARAIAISLLRSPSLLRRLFASASLAEERIDAQDDNLKVELSSIAVGAEGSGSGVGGQLLGEFCKAVALGGAKAVILTTDAVDNDAVNDFYTRAGFVLTREF